MASPVKILVHRPDFHKFSVAELGLDIRENPVTYADRGHDTHTSHERRRVEISVASIRKNNISYVAVIRGNLIALLPKTFPYTARQLGSLIISGKQTDEEMPEIIKKMQKGKQTLYPYEYLVDSWFRTAQDKRVEGAMVIDSDKLPGGFSEESYIKSNINYAFFNYLSVITNSYIVVRS